MPIPKLQNKEPKSKRKRQDPTGRSTAKVHFEPVPHYMLLASSPQTLGCAHLIPVSRASINIPIVCSTDIAGFTKSRTHYSADPAADLGVPKRVHRTSATPTGLSTGTWASKPIVCESILISTATLAVERASL